MKRRDFLKNASLGLAAASGGGVALADARSEREASSLSGPGECYQHPKDYKTGPFKRLVILGEAPWKEDRGCIDSRTAMRTCWWN